jgi:tetratricopeptide (TPR) repeat protein
MRRGRGVEADFYYNRGHAYRAMGNFNKALADYDEAIRLAPKDLRSYCGRARAFEEMGQFDKARADYDQATRFNATTAPDYLMIGYAQFAKGNYRAAASDFEKALRMSPRDYEALAYFAWFQATCPDDSLRNGNEALEKSRRACELSRWQDADTVDTLAAAYAEIGDFAEAIKYQTQAINMKGAYATRRKEMQERLELYRQHKPYRYESKLKVH